jgi:hypothetical protein
MFKMAVLHVSDRGAAEARGGTAGPGSASGDAGQVVRPGDDGNFSFCFFVLFPLRGMVDLIRQSLTSILNGWRPGGSGI